MGRHPGALLSLFLAACGAPPADSDTDVDTDIIVDEDTERDTEADSERDTEADSERDTEADSERDTEADSERDTEADTERDTEAAPCTTDTDEPNEWSGEATVLDALPVELRRSLCAGDTDAFEVPVPHATRYNTRCELDIVATSDSGAPLAINVLGQRDLGWFPGTTVGGRTDFHGVADPVYPAVFEVSSPTGMSVGDYTVVASATCEDRCETVGPEFNDTRDRSTDLPRQSQTVVDATLCPEDEDWFTIDTGVNCQLDIELVFDHTSQSNLSLQAIGQYPSDINVQARTGSDNETLSLRSDTHDLDLRVYADDPSHHAPYQLIIEQSCTGFFGCDEDHYESASGNDSEETALVLGGNDAQIDAVLCNEPHALDQDWYAFEVPSGCALDARMTAAGNLIDSALVVYGPDGTQQGSDDAWQDRHIRVDAASTGTYHVVPTAHFNSNEAYHLDVAIDCATTCDDVWEPNDTPGDVVTMPLSTAGGVCDEDDEDWFTLPFTTGCKLGVEVTHDSRHSSVALFNGTSERGTHSIGTSAQHILYSPRSSGTADLLIDGDTASYGLTAERFGCDAYPCEADPYEPNDALLQAIPLALDEEAQATLCEDDIDLWLLDQPGSCPRLVAIDSADILDVALLAADGSILYQTTSLDDVALAGDAAFLRLSGGRGASYTVRSIGSCAPLTCPQDDSLGAMSDTEHSGLLAWNASVDLAACAHPDWLRIPPFPTDCEAIIDVSGHEGPVRGTLLTRYANRIGINRSTPDGSTSTLSPDYGDAVLERWVRIRAEGSASAYTLTTELICDSDGE